MRNLFFGMIAAAFLTMTAAQAFAQVSPPGDDAAAFDSEFAAFKQKLATAKASGKTPDVADKKAANPLGPAAGLPVKGQLSATAGALAPSSALVPSTPEELKAQMEAEAAEQQKKLEEKTFDAALKQLLPLSPEQVRKVYEKFIISREAAETPIRVPELKAEVQTISLDPSQKPLVVHLTPGYITTLSILDSTGAPWPVQDMNFTGKFQITPPETGGNIIRITPMSAHGRGIVSMRLVDLVTPVFFTLATGLDETDYRFDARVSKPGPLAKTPIIEYGGLNTVAGTDENLVSVLDGTLPPDAEKLTIKGLDGRTSAWRLGTKVYLRTPLTLLSPAWNSSVASSDGTTVYTLNDTPIVLLSDEGRMVRGHIADADEVLP